MRIVKSEIASPDPPLPHDLKVKVMKSNILDEPEDRYDLSELKWKRFQQRLFLLLSDFESSKLVTHDSPIRLCFYQYSAFS